MMSDPFVCSIGSVMLAVTFCAASYFIVAHVSTTTSNLLLSDKEGSPAPHGDTIGCDVG